MAKLQRRILHTLIAGCLCATACGGEPAATSDDAQPDARAERLQIAADAAASRSDQPQQTEWSSDQLPIPYSPLPLATAAGNVIYRAVEGDTLYLTAVSSQDGTEQWRQEINPLGQLRGTAPTPLVLQELAIVVSPQFVDSEERLTAFDAITGEIIWSEDVDFYAVPAFRCGIDVCTHNEQKRTQYDALTGKRTTSFRAPHVETIFDSTVRHLFASGPRPTGNTDWVALHDAISGSKIWKADRSAVEEASGVTVSPEYGWSAIIDESNDIVAWYAGTNDPAFAGVWTGFDINSGEIRWTYASEQSCVFDDFAPDAILVCRIEGGEQSISRLDTATGNSMWSAVTGTSDDYVWTSAVGGFVFAESTNGLTVIDLETGNDIQPTDIQLCGFGQPWQSIDVGWWDEPVSYRAASLPALCDMDLAAVSAAEALELDPSLAAAAHVSVGNGWSVAVGVNGELSATHTG